VNREVSIGLLYGAFDLADVGTHNNGNRIGRGLGEVEAILTKRRVAQPNRFEIEIE